jgi:Tol biopolymer transport system component
MSEEERRIDKKKSLPVWGWVGIGIVLFALILGGFALQGQKGSGPMAFLATSTYTPTATFTPTFTPTPFGVGSGKIAFQSNRGGDEEIYVINADGSSLQQFTDNDWDDYDPAWSPDGSKIAFASYRDGDWEIYIINADGSGLQQLTDNDLHDWGPAWSPDGSKIAF